MILSVLWSALVNAPKFWFYEIKDFIAWIRCKGWLDFNYWGLHIFVGRFGAGKTISAVRRVYNICQAKRNVTVLTNLTLTGFPKDTKIIKLVNSMQILDLPDKSIVLIDEIGSIFNSRDWGSQKKCVPKPVYQHIVQCRHRRIMLIGTVQDWSFLDKQLRDIADSVTICRSIFAHPFTRYTTCIEYDAKQYDRSYTNPLVPIRSIGYYGYVQSDSLRKKYDTLEMVEGMLEADYLSDEEILRNRGELPEDPHELDRKSLRKLSKSHNKLGL